MPSLYFSGRMLINLLMRKKFISNIYEQHNLLTFKTMHRLSNNPLINLSLRARHTCDLDTTFF